MNAPVGAPPVANEADFLSRVLPWPNDESSGFINVHWTKPDKPGMPGKTVTRLGDFISLVEWAKNCPDICKDIYYCLSLQRDTQPITAGKRSALRKSANALCLKAIWLDVDVQEPPKGYKDRNEAFDAIAKFLVDAKLPPLSALVDFGGGFHLYWISDKLLDVATWLQYANGLRNLAEAHGLRCDLGVTIDCARILRVPGTVNRKVGTPRPVKLLALAKTDYDFEASLGHIRAATAPVHRVAATNRPGARNLVPFDAPARPPITDPDYIAECGVPHSYGDNLDPRPLVAPNGCPFLQEAFRTGGKDHDQSLWMMTGLVTTFLANGRKVFHEMSKGYKSYVAAETDKMFDRKVEDREEKDLGWPSCQTFQTYGAKQCGGCPHKGKIKSPLNLVLLQQTPQMDIACGTGAHPSAIDGAITDIKIDWSKVKLDCGWLRSVADLPDDISPELKIIFGHTGSLRNLNEDLIKGRLLAKGYQSWSEVTQAIAASLKSYGRYTPEQIAEALLVDLRATNTLLNRGIKNAQSSE